MQLTDVQKHQDSELGADDNTVLLEINNLHVYFYQGGTTVKAVQGVTFSIKKNSSVGIVGESGCGKTTVARSIVNLLPRTGKIVHGEILFRLPSGKVIDISKLPPFDKQMRDIRGKMISIIFQDPISALNPVYNIGMQVGEVFRFNRQLGSDNLKNRIIELLKSVNISIPEQRVSSYPFELSGGMCQRVMIAMALASKPRLLICDEPTSALDVTIQDQILILLEELKEKSKTSILFITHDLAIIAELVEEVIVMYSGSIVESGKVRDVFACPKHPYTQALLDSVPVLGQKKELKAIPGELPKQDSVFQGCSFFPRCVKSQDRCKNQPPISRDSEGHLVKCWLYV